MGNDKIKDNLTAKYRAYIKAIKNIQDIEEEINNIFKAQGWQGVYPTSTASDGPCIMFESKGETGVTFKEFLKMLDDPDFDINEVETYL